VLDAHDYRIIKAIRLVCRRKYDYRIAILMISLSSFSMTGAGMCSGRLNGVVHEGAGQTMRPYAGLEARGYHPAVI